VQIVNTYRLNAHSKGDDDRSEEEVKKWWEKEPLKYVETKITEDEMNQAKLSIEKRLKIIEKRVNDTEFGSIN
jgi:TPP-dependent pyruvate/acetoin dehydrogenase alpha subunit